MGTTIGARGWSGHGIAGAPAGSCGAGAGTAPLVVAGTAFAMPAARSSALTEDVSGFVTARA
jgi:hypothetical protein